jgi:hypothetical protein
MLAVRDESLIGVANETLRRQRQARKKVVAA